MAKSRGGTRPTGPNSKLQGKPLGVHYSQPKKGTTTGNGDMNGGGACVDCKPVRTPVIRGSRKSF